MNVLLIDDEPWALEGMRSSVRWDDYDLHILATLTDSIDALEYILDKKPDLVITDIRMPGLSGIELIREVRKKKLDIEFIIVSGYGEFEFAKEAIKLGAIDYILKPIDIDEVNQTIRKVSDYIKDKRVAKEITLFEDLLNNKGDFDFIVPSDFYQTNSFLQAVMLNGVFEDQETVKLLERFSHKKLCLGTNKTFYMICVEANIDCSLRRDQVRTHKGIIGLSRISKSISDIPKLTKEADKCSYLGFLSKKNGIQIYTEFDYALLQNILQDLYTSIALGMIDEVCNILDSLPEMIEKNNMGVDGIVFLWNQLVAYTLNKFGREAEGLDFEFMDYVGICNKYGELKNFIEEMKDCYGFLLSAKEATYPTDDSNESFNALLQYIHENYHQDIQLKKLAKQFHFNFTYCSNLFNKVVGKSFSKYVTELRIKKACELLVETTNPIRDISVAVGFQDYYYFNKVFKKYMGATPMQYRRIGA